LAQSIALLHWLGVCIVRQQQQQHQQHAHGQEW
jgi:hypothetical protein